MIPDFQTIMLPFMKQLADGKVHALKDILHALAEEFKLTQEERCELLPSGADRKFDNRVRWSRMRLGKAELLEAVQTGKYRITKRGLELLRSNPKHIDVALLKQYP